MRVCKYLNQRLRRIGERNGKLFKGVLKTKRKKHMKTKNPTFRNQCQRNTNSARQQVSHSNSLKRIFGAKAFESFAIWLKYCTGRSYLETQLMNEANYFSSVI